MSFLKFLIRILLTEAGIEIFLRNSCTIYERQIILLNSRSFIMVCVCVCVCVCLCVFVCVCLIPFTVKASTD